MNNNPRQIRPPFRGLRPNQPHLQNGNAPPVRSPVSIVRAKPPSFSRAPWDVTQWVDPIQAQNPKLKKKPEKIKFGQP